MRKITDAGTYNTKDGKHVPIAFRGKSDKHNAKRSVKEGRYVDVGQGTGMEDLYAIMEKYKMKGFEFGNWVTQEERAEYVAALTPTFETLVSILGSRNVGIDKNVGLAFGARGSRGASAHYEPVLNMINLTRERGAGTLAHEYGHALDFNLGAFVDRHKDYTALSGGSSTAATLPENEAGQLRALVNQIVDSIRNGKNFAEMDRINKEYMQQTGSPRYSSYWYRRTEIFARFFEQYVSYRLYERKTNSRLLVRSWAYYTASAVSLVYVEMGDFMKIKPLGDKLMAEFAKFLNSTSGARVRATKYPKPVIVKPKPKAEVKQLPKPTAAGKAAATKKKTTPTEEGSSASFLSQYEEIKKKYPDAMLLFRSGDFYEIYKEDAKEASKILNITLTYRGKERIEACGFPFHALDTYLPKLVRAGKRVAICDQLEDPKKAKGLVKRGVSELAKPAKTSSKKAIDKRDVQIQARKLGIIEGSGQSVHFTGKLKDLVKLYRGHKQEVLSIACDMWAEDTIRRRGGGIAEHYKEEALKEARRVLANRKKH